MTPPDRVPTYELVLDDEPDEREPAQPVAASWRRVIALALAFSVGVALGVGGTAKQRDAADARQRAATLSLTAFSESWQPPDVGPDADRIQLSFRLLNNGPLPVHVESMALDVPGFALGEEQDRRFTVDPGGFARTSALIGLTNCDEQPTRGETTVSARVTARLESGETDDVDVPIELLGFTMNDIWMISCDPQYYGGGVWADITGPAEIIETADGPAASATLHIGHEGEQPEQITVSGNEYFDLRTTAPDDTLPLWDSQVTAEFVPRMCPNPEQLAEATTQGFIVEIVTSDGQQGIELGVWDPELLVALIEVIHLHCDDT